MEFDLAGEWLLTVSRDSMLYAWKVDGSGMEVLPRGMWKGTLLRKPEAVLGVAGGFALGGRIDHHLVVMKYDIGQRTCTAYPIGPCLGLVWEWSYAPEYQALVVNSSGSDFRIGYALDLTTGTLYRAHDAGPDSRACQAYLTKERVGLPARRLRILNAPLKNPTGQPTSVYLDPDRGTLHMFRQLLPKWQPFTPLADGRPSLHGSIALEAQCCRTTLALKTTELGRKDLFTLRLFSATQGIPLAEYRLLKQNYDFVLSADGRWLARQVGEGQIKVHEVAGDSRLLCLTRLGGSCQQYRFSLGPTWLRLRVGKQNVFVIRWERGPLEIKHWRAQQTGLVTDPDHGWGEKPATATGIPHFVQDDPGRFMQWAQNQVIAVGDRFGQVAVFDPAHKLVCMFFAFREQVAAWMPDGTCYGPAALTGGPPTAGALEKLGQALRQASAQGRRQP
jgi:hypothetical protein